MKKLPLKVKLYLFCIYVLAFSSLYLSFKNNYIKVEILDIKSILFFSVLVFSTESLSVFFKDMVFSTSFSVQLATLIIFGPLITIIVTIIGFSFRILKRNGSYRHVFNTPFYGTMSNNCSLIILIVIGNLFYKLLGGSMPITINSFSKQIIPLFGFCISFYIFNIFIISVLYSIMANKNFLYCFISNIKLVFLNIIIMAPFGIILAFIYWKFSYFGVLFFIFPILLARYTFSLYITAKEKYIETIDVLMHAMEARDKYTQGHTKRVAELSREIAKELKYNQWKIDDIYMAGLLHDVGKIGIDDAILNKPGKLTDEEYSQIKNHPEIGYSILNGLRDTEKINFIVRHHHERYDGKGYPFGKKPEELILDVFIIQLADSVDAMETDRPYRKALTLDKIIEEVKLNKGTQFHPEVVEAYLRHIEKSGKVTSEE